jgi:hypothetical protein
MPADIPFARTSQLRHLNFYVLSSVPLAALAKYQTCTNWFGGESFIYSEPYDFDPKPQAKDLVKDT